MHRRIAGQAAEGRQLTDANRRIPAWIGDFWGFRVRECCNRLLLTYFTQPEQLGEAVSFSQWEVDALQATLRRPEDGQPDQSNRSTSGRRIEAGRASRKGVATARWSRCRSNWIRVPGRVAALAVGRSGEAVLSGWPFGRSVSASDGSGPQFCGPVARASTLGSQPRRERHCDCPAGWVCEQGERLRPWSSRGSAPGDWATRLWFLPADAISIAAGVPFGFHSVAVMSMTCQFCSGLGLRRLSETEGVCGPASPGDCKSARRVRCFRVFPSLFRV